LPTRSHLSAFHAGTHATGCQAGCDDTTPDDGQLYIAPVSGGGAIRLAAIDDPPAASDRNASVEPTFDPTAAGGYSWVVFTSMRDWGNMGWPVAAGEDVTKAENFKRRLWVAAVDTSIGMVDPSHPASTSRARTTRRTCAVSGPTPSASRRPRRARPVARASRASSAAPGFFTNGMCASVSNAGVSAYRRDVQLGGGLLQRKRRRLLQRRRLLARHRALVAAQAVVERRDADRGRV
jgi:hypothetical protein